VVTEHGPIACRAVILAAGAWSALFLRHLGFALPQLKVKASVQRTAMAPLITESAVGARRAAFGRRQDGGYTIARSGTVSFDLTASNSGPNPATGVRFTDVLPAGLDFVSATPSQGTFDSATGFWDVGTIAVGATIQIALFTAPLLVLVSYALGNPMNLVFDNPLELIAVAGVAFAVNAIAQDGETNWFEGVLLITVYALFCLAFFFVR